MLRKITSVSFMAVWLALVGFDIAGDMGWIHDRPKELDVSVDAALGNFGEAIKSSGDSHSTTTFLVDNYLGTASISQDLSIQRDISYPLQINTAIFVGNVKTHNLLQVFLI